MLSKKEKPLDLYVFWENEQVEFLSKLLISSQLIKNSKINLIKLGSTKVLINKILNEPNTTVGTNLSFLYKDIWAGSEVLLVLSEIFSANYFSLQEEDYIIYHTKLITKVKNTFLKYNLFNKIGNFFTISKLTKDFYVNYYSDYKIKQKIKITGNPRYDLLKIIKKNGHYKNHTTEKKILLSLNGPIFANNKLKLLVRFDKTIKPSNNEIYTGSTIKDKIIHYQIVKSFLRMALRIARRNIHHQFILRPHPLDSQFEKYYLKLIKKMPNVELSIKYDIFYCLDKSKKVISPPDNVSLEAVMFDLPTLAYYQNDNIMNNYIFADHPFVRLYPNNIATNDFDVEKFINSENLKNVNNVKLIELYNVNSISSDLIGKFITEHQPKEIKLRLFQKFKLKLFIFFLKKIAKQITIDIENKNFNNKSYINFSNRNKYSLSRLYFFYYLKDFNIKLDFHNILYKYCIGKNYDEHNKNHISSFFKKLDLEDIKYFLNYYKLIDSKKTDVDLDNDHQILLFKKK
jgi:hypothetical protein